MLKIYTMGDLFLVVIFSFSTTWFILILVNSSLNSIQQFACENEAKHDAIAHKLRNLKRSILNKLILHDRIQRTETIYSLWAYFLFIRCFTICSEYFQQHLYLKYKLNCIHNNIIFYESSKVYIRNSIKMSLII